jgi:putative Holliday junction resolvase
MTPIIYLVNKVIVLFVVAVYLPGKLVSSFTPYFYRFYTKNTPLHLSPEFKENESLRKIEYTLAQHTTSTSSVLGIKSIGVDYGLVRTGIAVSVGYNPKPLGILSDLNSTQLCTRIIEIAESESTSQIILGLPLHKNGTIAEQTIITRDFATKLICAVYSHFGPDSMPIYLWDERYTSREAEARALANNPKANTYKELDADAACIILEHYYTENGVGAERVLLPDDENIQKWVQQAWIMRKDEKTKKIQSLQLERERSLNARQLAMEKARLFDEKMAKSRSNCDDETILTSTTKKNKGKGKNNNKKAKSNGANKWITL